MSFANEIPDLLNQQHSGDVPAEWMGIEKKYSPEYYQIIPGNNGLADFDLFSYVFLLVSIPGNFDLQFAIFVFSRNFTVNCVIRKCE